MTSSASDPSITAGDVAAVILRAALAGTMIAHGVRHARTLEGTAGWFGSIGFDKPELQAKVSAAVEIGSGAALALGLATPLSASAVVGTMSVAYMSVHRPNGYFVIKEGWEYVPLWVWPAPRSSWRCSGAARRATRQGRRRAGAQLAQCGERAANVSSGGARGKPEPALPGC
jgi:putative oxidoreductase